MFGFDTHHFAQAPRTPQPTWTSAACALTNLQSWDPQRGLDLWAASLNCTLNASTIPALAKAEYSASMNSTGWDVVEVVIHCDAELPAGMGCQAGAATAGFLEGLLTAQRTSDHLFNLLSHEGFLNAAGTAVDVDAPKWKDLLDYMEQQEQWMHAAALPLGQGVLSVAPALYAQQAGISPLGTPWARPPQPARPLCR